MKITIKNIDNIEYILNSDYCSNLSSCKELLQSMLYDVDEFNNMLHDKGFDYLKIYIDYNDSHTEYSSERTDPSPDYFGTFSLRFEKNPHEHIGLEMDIRDLDINFCTLYNFVESILS